MRDGGTMRWLMLQVAELVVAAQRRSIPAEIHIECMCKSGRHRSVAVAFLLAGALAANGLEFDGAVHRAADWWSAVPCQRGGAECELCFGPGKIKSQVGGVSMLKPRVQLCIETGKRLIYGVWSYCQFYSRWFSSALSQTLSRLERIRAKMTSPNQRSVSLAFASA